MADNVREDLARLRAIAEEGRRLPLVGGRILILWGCAIALATLIQGAIMNGMLAWPPLAIAAVWGVVVIVALVLSRLPGMTGADDLPSGDLGNRLERQVWRIGGGFLGLLAGGLFVAATAHQQATGDPVLFALFAAMPPVTFGVYAMMLRSAAEISGQSMLRHYSGLSLAFVAITALLVGQGLQLPVTTAAVLLVSVLPGMMLVRLERGARGRGEAHG